VFSALNMLYADSKHKDTLKMSAVEEPLTISEFTNSNEELQFNAHLDLIQSAANFSNYASQAFNKHLDEMSSIFIHKLDAAKWKIFNGCVLQIKPTVLNKSISANATMLEIAANGISLNTDKMYVVAVVVDTCSMSAAEEINSGKLECFNGQSRCVDREQNVRELHVSISQYLWFNVCQRYNISTSSTQQCMLTVRLIWFLIVEFHHCR